MAYIYDIYLLCWNRNLRKFGGQKVTPFLHPRSEALNIERIELFMAMNEDA